MPESKAGAGTGSAATPADSIESLIAALASRSGTERHRARIALQNMGRRSVPALLQALESPSENVRWEAAKALGNIRDPQAGPALVDALEDEDPAVRWLAAEGLIALGRHALVPVLSSVERCTDNEWLQQGVVQVLHALVKEDLAPEAAPVLAALEGPEASVAAPAAAYRLLRHLQDRRT